MSGRKQSTTHFPARRQISTRKRPDNHLLVGCSLTRVDAGPGCDHNHVSVGRRWDQPILQERPLQLHRRVVQVLETPNQHFRRSCGPPGCIVSRFTRNGRSVVRVGQFRCDTWVHLGAKGRVVAGRAHQEGQAVETRRNGGGVVVVVVVSGIRGT